MRCPNPINIFLIGTFDTCSRIFFRNNLKKKRRIITDNETFYQIRRFKKGLNNLKLETLSNKGGSQIGHWPNRAGFHYKIQHLQ